MPNVIVKCENVEVMELSVTMRLNIAQWQILLKEQYEGKQVNCWPLCDFQRAIYDAIEKFQSKAIGEYTQEVPR